jgi:RNA polymerase-binding transcription factor
MDVQVYQRRLLELEASLSQRATHAATRGREQFIDTAADTGDESMADELESEDFTEAELDATLLREVRDALQRIKDGTFGRCAADGHAMPGRRLDAVPWARYCLKHQALIEATSRRKPTL